MNCPLCHHQGRLFYQTLFYECENCNGIYMGKRNYPDKIQEKARYETHNNDVNDPGYQKFVSPITNRVLACFKPMDKGLDFGSGTGPVVSKVLKDNGYTIKQYDPFFADFPELLSQKYDYIVCCEVMEHFHHPDEEFKKLHSMLNPGGALLCMTHLYNEEIDFTNWYYKNDPTHVFIYQEATITFIAKKFNFTSYKIDGRLIVFTV